MKSMRFQLTSTSFTLHLTPSIFIFKTASSPVRGEVGKSYARSMKVLLPTPDAPITATYISRMLTLPELAYNLISKFKFDIVFRDPKSHPMVFTSTQFAGFYGR